MAQLEELTRGTAVRGILPDCLVTISDVRWIGTVAIEVTYKDSNGRLGNELLYRDREPTLGIAESGQPWSFDGDPALFRLLSEAKAMAQLSHPNVVTIHEAAMDRGRVFLAMEYVAGRTVGSWLRVETPGWREIVTVFRASRLLPGLQ